MCFYWAGLLLLISGFPSAPAQKSEGFRVISWSPAMLQSGSPVLFTIELDQPASEVHGTWLNHALVFTRRPQGNTWFALAGIDVEQAPGTYSLELTATGSYWPPAARQPRSGCAPGSYKTTTLHVEEKYVQPDAATLQRIAADKASEGRGVCAPDTAAPVERQLSLSRAFFPDRLIRDTPHVQRDTCQYPPWDRFPRALGNAGVGFQ